MKSLSKNFNKKSDAGFMAITAVLIIGAIVLILGVAIFHSALTDYSITTAYESGQKAAFLANYCLREGIVKLQKDINYIGGEEVKFNEEEFCTINFVKDIDSGSVDVKIKEISSLGRAGEQPHFSRLSQKVLYIIESSAEDWEREGAELKNLIVGDSLRLQSAETKPVLNEASGISCDEKCQQEGQKEGIAYQCISIGTDYPDAINGEVKFCEEE